jgi:hypothetical protein
LILILRNATKTLNYYVSKCFFVSNKIKPNKCYTANIKCLINNIIRKQINVVVDSKVSRISVQIL